MRKICNFLPFNIYCIMQLNENVSNFCFSVYVASFTTTTTMTVLRPFVWDYPGEPVLEETPTLHHPDHHPIFISFFHLPRSIAFFLFKLRDWQSFCTTSFHVLFGLPLGLEPSLHVVNQQKVCLLPEVFKPSMAVYDTVVECHRMVWLNKR